MKKKRKGIKNKKTLRNITMERVFFKHDKTA